MRDPHVVDHGIAVCREALSTYGILLVQDATLPSVTTFVAGGPVRGSWWSHEQAHSIFDVLETLENETTTAKLVAKKLTLVARDLWPALAATGSEGAEWQRAGLTAGAASVEAQVRASAHPTRSDMLTTPDGPKLADLVRELEHRLLVASDEVHTERGRHVKVLQSWSGWVAERSIGKLPSADAARARLESAVHSVAPDRVAKLLPWPVESGT